MTPYEDGMTRGRVEYLPIVDRPALVLPGNGRVAVWVVVNVENWSAATTMPRAVLPPPMGQMLLPDIPNWSWHEYGMRLGFWRILDALKARGIRASFAVNGTACDVYRRACEAALAADWDFIGHGHVQRPMHGLDDERAEIERALDAIAAFTGRRPLGWESPGLTETASTLDLLHEAGIEFVCNWVLDDLPTRLKTRSGSLVSIPYTVEVNDVVMTAIQQKDSDEILKRGRDQFDRLYLEGRTLPRIMAISVHPYLTGVPHRIKYFEMLLDYIVGHADVALMTGSEICRWYQSADPAPVRAR